MLLPIVKKNLFEGEAMSQLLIDIQLPIGTSRTRTNEVVSRYEKRFYPLSETEKFSRSTPPSDS